MSDIVATLDEPIVNRFFAQTDIRGSLTREIKDPLFAIKLGTVTLNYEANEFRAHLQEGRIRYTAKVHARSNIFSYSDDVEGSITVAIEGKSIVLAISAMIITLSIKIHNRRFDIAKVDVAQRLPPELKRLCLKFLPEDILAPLPGGGNATLKITNPKVALHPGRMVVSADLT